MFDSQARFDRMRTSQRGAVSSVGRAMPLQGMGHKFESCTAHHILRSHEQGQKSKIQVLRKMRTGSSVG